MNIKKRDIIIYMVVLISLLAIFSVFLIATDVVKFGSNNNDGHPAIDDSTVVEFDNSDWIDYVLSAKITDIKITRKRSTEFGDDKNFNKTVTINVEDLNKILTSLKKHEIAKHYTLGFGGLDSDHLTVKYEIDGKSYKFEIYYDSIVPNYIDEGLANILESNNYKEMNVENKELDGAFYFYNIIGFSSTIYDEYFD